MSETAPTIPPEYDALTKLPPESANEYWRALSPEPAPQVLSLEQPWQNRSLQPRIAPDTTPTPEEAARFNYFAGGMEWRERQRLQEQQRQQEILRQREEWLRQYAVETPPQGLKGVMSRLKVLFASRRRSPSNEQFSTRYPSFLMGGVGVAGAQM